MKYLILLLLIGCSTITTSKHRCDNKVGIEQENCMIAYINYVRSIDYDRFRGASRNSFRDR